MMRNIRLGDWARLYGVTFSFERVRWYSWLATMRGQGYSYTVAVNSFSQPAPEMAFREFRDFCREAHLCGTYEGWLSRQSPGRERDWYLARWSERERALGRLESMVGRDGAQRFLWGVRE